MKNIMVNQNQVRSTWFNGTKNEKSNEKNNFEQKMNKSRP